MVNKFQASISVDGIITVTYKNGKSLSFSLKDIAGLDEYRQAIKAKAQVVQSPVAAYAAKPVAVDLTACHRCGKKNLAKEVIAWSTGRKTFGFKPTCRECQLVMSPPAVGDTSGAKFSLGLRCKSQSKGKECNHLVSNERAKWSEERFGVVVCKDCYSKDIKVFEAMAVAVVKSKTAL